MKITVLFLMLFPTAVWAQCPAGFTDAGEVSASVNAGRYQEISVTKEVLLPKGLRLDTSYHQKSIRAAGDGAASDMRASEIPAGIYLIPTGRAGGGWWSISNPRLEASAEGLLKFKIDLYANSGSRSATAQAAADVRVHVCFRSL